MTTQVIYRFETENTSEGGLDKLGAGSYIFIKSTNRLLVTTAPIGTHTTISALLASNNFIEITNTGNAWKANSNYKIGDLVAYKEKFYIAKTNSKNSIPKDGPTWVAIGAGGGAYDPTATYSKGDMVSSNGDTWIANGPVPAGVVPPAAPWIRSGEVTFLNVAGDTMTGAINMNNNVINNLPKATGPGNPVTPISYATPTQGGVIKLRRDGDKLFITTDGSNA